MLLRKRGGLTRTVRHLKRYRQILSILFKYGFGDWLDRLHVGAVLERGLKVFSRGSRERLSRLTRSERVRIAVEELGPTFVKLAQILSTRPDLIPLELTQELEKLQDQVPPFPFAQAKEIVEAELKGPLEEKFRSFEEVPLAAASIGQVHRAVLRDGREVVVKVQRPGIRRVLEVDLEILYYLASLSEKYLEEAELHRPTRLVEEFARTLDKEIDYQVEAAQAERFARQFQGHPFIFVPRIFREFSTSRLLTMEFVQGTKISEISTLDQGGFDRKAIASRGADLILEQIFKHGFFHADPHPGNVFILPGNIVCYLDYGMMGSVNRQGREDFADILQGVIRHNESRITQALLRIVQWDEEPDRRELERDIADIAGFYLHQPLKELRLAVLWKQLIELITRHRLRFPPDIFLMLKAIAIVEAIGVSLDPDFDLTAKAAPFMERIMMERFYPARVLEGVLDSGTDVARLMKDLPGDLGEILRQAKQGRINIGFEHRGLEEFISHLHRVSNRLAVSLLAAALVVGSALMSSAGIGPLLWGIPVPGFLGFVIAGVLVLSLLFSILRSGRL